MKYGTAIGNWGDVLCSLGFYQQNVGSGGVVYYGGTEGMYEFLKAQDFIHDVKMTRHKDSAEFRATMDALWTPGLYQQGLLTVLGNTNLTPDDITHTALNYEESTHYNNVYPIARNLNLPEEAKEWAAQVAKNMPRPFFLVQPYSINTVNRNGHWPYWWEYMLWIIRDKNKSFITVGKDWDDEPFSEFSNVYRMVKKTPNMNYVFALAEEADGVITTSNSLAHYCVCQNIKCIVCGTIRNTDPKDFFTKIIQGENVKLFGYYSKLIKVCAATEETFEIWPTF